MRFCAQTTLCLLTILIAAKGSGIAQLIYKKREKAVFLTFPRGCRGYREKRTTDVSVVGKIDM